MLKAARNDYLYLALDETIKSNGIISCNTLPPKWVEAIVGSASKWSGPQIANVLKSRVNKKRSAALASDRIVRLYNEAFKATYGRNPYTSAIVKELRRTLYFSVLALCGSGKMTDWTGSTIASALIHSFRTLLYTENAPNALGDSLWRFLSTCTLPLANQSSRSTKHTENWFDFILRNALLQTASNSGDWKEARLCGSVHPEMVITVVSQVEAAERSGHCTESESDIMRQAFSMCPRPDGVFCSDFDVLQDILKDDSLLVEYGGQASDVESLYEEFSLHLRSPPPPPPPPPVNKAVNKTGPKPSIQANRIRLISALDNRKNWRRQDGTLYSYFRITKHSVTPIASKLASPHFCTADLTCSDEAPITESD